ncbi:MAG: KH domain-containing protein [Kofleriaceae bacterium]|nr:KH domain-containing protein [Kofleriaceae bacterium]MBP9166587.1 KH domain-containing protein [Kofleriaceae bacterium]MBP9859667.1 KH domain-containing protein [Kofleriaceae bacterium]
MTEATEATNANDVAERACDFLMGLLDRMGIAADIDVNESDDKIVLDVQTSDPDVVIGRKGQVVDALQHVVSKHVYRERSGEKGKPIIVDAGGYRDKHVLRLEALAQRMSEKALASKEIVELAPMSAHDRRVVHMAIANIPGVSSRSEGEGDDRHILVVPDALAAE